MTTISDRVTSLLQCPACKSRLKRLSGECKCVKCHRTYPIVDGVPVIIHEDNSVFRIEEIITKVERESKNGLSQFLKPLLRKVIPSISANWVAEDNYRKFGKLLRENVNCPIVLVLGSGTKGKGIDALVCDGPIGLVVTDVYLGNNVDLVCDAHDVPFESTCFDGVIIQAVLEHVLDPWRCVSEIYRLLKPNGLVYAETPFMQQVHMGCYDFTRFSHLGHRRLFRNFTEIESGMCCGPGMALATAYQYFLTSFFNDRRLRGLAIIFAHFTGFWLKYFDKYLLNMPAAIDAASGCYFLGRKAELLLSDRNLLKLYRGAFKTTITNKD